MHQIDTFCVDADRQTDRQNLNNIKLKLDPMELNECRKRIVSIYADYR